MKIVKYNGCYDSTLTIDGKYADEYIDDCSTEELRDIFHKVITQMHDKSIMIDLLNDAVGLFGECTLHHHCEQCGDTNMEFTIEI